MLLSNEACELCLRLLTGKEFYREAHRQLFAAIYSLNEARVAVDIRTLANELKQMGEFETIGGVSALSALIDRVPTAANAEYYANIVKEKSQSRELINAATQVVADAYSDSVPVRELLEEAELRILTVTQIKEHGDVSPESWAIQETERLTKKGYKSVIPTGFPNLDEILGGAEKGVMTTLAGKKENGKTTFAVNVMLHMAKKGVKVGAVCLEDAPTKLIYRMVCAMQGWSIAKLKSMDEALITADDKTLAFNSWASLQMRVCGRRQVGRKWVRVKNWIKYQHKENGVDFFLIDSGSMLEPVVERGWELFDAKEKMIDEISDLAEDLNIALWVTGHQAAKEGENLEMKGTNQWGHNARVQLHMGFHKDHKKDKRYENITILNVVKNSDGDKGLVWFEGNRKNYKLKEVDKGEFAEQPE